MKDLIALILDDNPFDSRILSTILRAHGFKQIISTDEFVEACNLVNQEQVSIVFIDIVLTEGNGLGFLDFIRTSPVCKIPDLPVVIVSAHTEQKWVEKAISSGADDYIQKPMSPATVIHKIGLIINGNRPAFTKWQLDSLRKDKNTNDDVAIVDCNE